MAITKRCTASMLVASGILCAAQAVAAGESGSFSYVASLVHDYTTLEHAGQTFTGGPLHGTVTVTESSGGPFVEGEHGVAACLVYSRKSDAGMDLETPCTNTDASGERWFLMAIRKAGDIQVGGGGEGRQELMGGTGKYAGLNGACTYTAAYLSGDRVVSQARCEWRKP